jgi:hypothetical protein
MRFYDDWLLKDLPDDVEESEEIEEEGEYEDEE